LSSGESVPADILRLILTQIDQSHRLKSCALVSKAWSAAAAAATTSASIIICDGLDAPKLASLWLWMRNQGRQSLNQLILYGWTRDACGDVYGFPFDEQLKLPQLENLLILGGHHTTALAATRNDGNVANTRQQNPFAGMSGLTSLRLYHMEFNRSTNGLAALSLLTRLQLLDLHDVHLPPDQLEQVGQQPGPETSVAPRFVAVHPVCFQQLTQLTSLSFNPGLCGRRAVAPFSCLQQLQALDLCEAVSNLDVLQALPQSLTMLYLAWDGRGVLSSSTAPSLAALTALKRLRLTSQRSELCVGIHPSLLSGMQQLQQLHLGGMPTDALPALLEVVSVLKQLQVFYIADVCMLGGGVQPLPGAQVEQYSKLLPGSSQLSSVTFTTSNSQMLTQEGCMRAIFNPARQLDSLKELVLDLTFPEVPGGFEIPAAINVFGSQELRDMARCCPNLAKLHIPRLMRLGPDLSIPLLWKNSLTSLALGGASLRDASVAAAVTKLTNLRELIIKDAPYVGDLGLLRLTALTNLCDLTLENCGLSEEIETDHGALYLVSPVRFFATCV